MPAPAASTPWISAGSGTTARVRSVRFGTPSTPGRIDAPLGHTPMPGGTLKPRMAGPTSGVPGVYGPAGSVNLTIADFLSWAVWNAAEGKRPPALVKPETLKRLHTPVIAMPGERPTGPGLPSGEGYAMGWGVTKISYAAEPLVTHHGSDGANLAMIALVPSRDYAAVLVTNAGGIGAQAR